MKLFFIVLSLMLPTLLGFFVISLLERKEKLRVGLKVILSYGLGTGFLSWIMLVGGCFQWPYHYNVITGGMIGGIIACLFFWLWKKQKEGHTRAAASEQLEVFSKEKRSPLNALGVLALAFIGGRIFFYFILSLKTPIFSWDSFSTIIFNTKVIFFSHSLENLSGFPHPEYPLYTPFLGSWLSWGLGEFHDQWIKVIFPLTSICVLVFQYYFLSNFVNKNYALMGCALTLFSEKYVYYSIIAYNEIILLYYHTVVILMLILWRSRKEGIYFVLASLFAGITVSVKVEGTYYVMISWVLCGLLLLEDSSWKPLRRLKYFVIFGIPAMVTGGLYSFLHRSKGINAFGDSRSHLDIEWSQLQKIPLLLEKIGLTLFGDSQVNLIWILFCLSLLCWRSIKRNFYVQVLLISLILHFGFISLLGLFTGSSFFILGAGYTAVLQRIVVHFYVLVTSLIVLIFSDHLSRSKKKEGLS